MKEKEVRKGLIITEFDKDELELQLLHETRQQYIWATLIFLMTMIICLTIISVKLINLTW